MSQNKNSGTADRDYLGPIELLKWARPYIRSIVPFLSVRVDQRTLSLHLNHHEIVSPVCSLCLYGCG